MRLVGSNPSGASKKNHIIWFFLCSNIFIHMIINEGKLEDIIEKYKENFNEKIDNFSEGLTPDRIIRHLYDMDPSPSKKYFEWMVKQCLDLLKKGFIINNDLVGKLAFSVILFDKNLFKLDKSFLEYHLIDIGENIVKFLSSKPLKDINTYDYLILRKVSTLLDSYTTENQRRKIAKKGATEAFNDDKYYIFDIDTYDASCFYGAGSQWCTTSKESSGNFKTYGTGSRKLLYVISKTKTRDSDPIYYKIAINIKYDSNTITFWNAIDKSFNGWNYFKNEDVDVITFLIEYIKYRNPEKYMSMIPDEIVADIQQKENNLTDLDVILMLPENRTYEWLCHKYNINGIECLEKKLEILINGGVKDLRKYFPEIEIKQLVMDRNVLSEHSINWLDFVGGYRKLAIIFSDVLPNMFINNFLDGDKNKVFEISKTDKLLQYWLLRRNDNILHNLGKVFGAEKIIKFILKYGIDSEGYEPINLGRLLTHMLTTETPKKRKELFTITYAEDNVTNVSLDDYLIDKLTSIGYIASFNISDDYNPEDKSYGRAFLHLKQTNSNLLNYVFDITDLFKVFTNKDKGVNYLFKNPDDFNGDINIDNLINLFAVDPLIDSSNSKFKYMSEWEKRNYINSYRVNEGAKNLFNYVVKKFSFKKLADITSYDEVFTLFCLVRYTKGIKYIMESNLGDVKIDDIKFVDNRPVLVVNDRADYSFIFYDEDLAERILGEDGIDWEPYHDVVSNWYDDVWSCVNSKSLELVKDWIRGHVPNFEDEDGETVELNDTFLSNIDGNDLGRMIDEFDEFEELKSEMKWAYDDGYNSEAQSLIYEDVYDKLSEYLGKYLNYEKIETDGRRFNKDTQKYETYKIQNFHYLYDLGDLFYDTLYDYAFTNLGYTHDYNTYYSTLLNDSEIRKLYIDTDNYPSHSKVCEYFNDALSGRI
jgi:hypothetical protein